MDKFKFSDDMSSWPDWFDDLFEKGKVRIITDTDPAHEDDDNWRLYWIYIAYLWTPDEIVVAYEGDTIVNHGTYCGLEQNGL